MADTVSVTQADREAAAELYELFPALSSSPEAGLKTAEFIRAGGADGWTSIGLFARHRLASTQPAPAFPREEVAKACVSLIERMAQYEWDASNPIGPQLYLDEAKELAALLQGKQP